MNRIEAVRVLAPDACDVACDRSDQNGEERAEHTEGAGAGRHGEHDDQSPLKLLWLSSGDLVAFGLSQPGVDAGLTAAIGSC